MSQSISPPRWGVQETRTRRRWNAAAASICLMIGSIPLSGTAADRDYPERPIDIVVTWGAGGGADQFARTITRIMSKKLKANMPVSNITGAAGNAGLTNVANATPDGYTVGVLTGQTAATWARKGAQFGVDDFAYIAVVQETPSMYVVAADSRFSDYETLLDYAKKNPNELKVGTSGYDTLDALAVRFLSERGYPMVNVPYRKAGERYMAPLGGHVDIIFEDPSGVARFFEAGQLRPIVVFGKERHPAFPEVPTTYEFDQDISLPNWRAFVTHKDTPNEIVARLNEAVRAAAETADWQGFCKKTYTCIRIRTPEESKEFVAEFVATIGKVTDMKASE